MVWEFPIHKVFNRCCLLVCGALISWTVGGAAVASPPKAALNEWCPVMSDEKVDPAITVEYRGETIGLCCDICVKKFLANPTKYEHKLPQFAEGVKDSDAKPHSASEHEHAGSVSPGYHEGVDIAEPSKVLDQDGHGHGAAELDDEREPILGRLHPIVIHFPIAGMPLALLGFIVWVRSGREVFARSDVIPLFAATLASIAAVITGNIAHDSMRFSESLHVIVERHQLVSTTIMVMAICLSLVRLWRWNRLVGNWRWVYGGGLAVVCALLSYTGFLGGCLVFGPDHLAW